MTHPEEKQGDGFSSIPAINYDRSDSRRRQTRTMFSGNFFLFITIALLILNPDYWYVFVPLIFLILYLMQKMRPKIEKEKIE